MLQGHFHHNLPYKVIPIMSCHKLHYNLTSIMIYIIIEFCMIHYNIISVLICIML